MLRRDFLRGVAAALGLISAPLWTPRTPRHATEAIEVSFASQEIGTAPRMEVFDTPRGRGYVYRYDDATIFVDPGVVAMLAKGTLAC